MSVQLSDPVEKLKFVRDSYSKLLAKLGISSIGDLLTHFPRYYIDSSVVTPIAKINASQQVTLRVKVDTIKNIYTKSRKQLQQAEVSDQTGSIKVVWFNQPFLTRTIKKGGELFLSGEVKVEYGKAVLYGPDYEVIGKSETTHLGRISGSYPLTRGITIKWLKKRLFDCIQNLTEFESPTDTQFELTCYEAIKQIHFPPNQRSLVQAKGRLSIEELISIMLRVERTKMASINQLSVQIKKKSSLVEQFIESLPFKLTSEQLQAIAEITSDLEKPHGMNRLLQGDVGSGKTVVALAAALACVEGGYQAAILAPTVILAQQHFSNTINLINKLNVKVGLVTATSKADPDCKIIVGTSAVLARKKDQFSNLGLVIVDEQHRFGVNQRLELKELLSTQDNLLPNLLDMTATPIPRSIALTFFGDMELSRITTKPVGRLPINTRIVPEEKRKECYNWIQNQLNNGRQAYWVCPLITESEMRETKAAKTTYAELSKAFAPFKVGLLHGKLKESEKTKVMQDFKEKRIDLLVATTVIEVGIDVANATVMVIEDADRLGLAQLHQIRGRVGRSSLQSWCFVFESKEISEAGQKRLQFFASEADGLKIAEFDLQNRGPGEVYGTRQSGIPDLKIAKLNNYEMIMQAKQIARDLIKLDSEVSLPLF